MDVEKLVFGFLVTQNIDFEKMALGKMVSEKYDFGKTVFAKTDLGLWAVMRVAFQLRIPCIEPLCYGLDKNAVLTSGRYKNT